MNVLMVGAGGGSFQIRGVQLGAAIGARVTSSPTAADWRWADLAVLVKRYGAQHAPAAHAAGVPIVWDALDFWRQPRDNAVDEARALALLAEQIAAITPVLTIGATQMMADDARGVYLPHHTWPGRTPAPVRPQVETVGYEGDPRYLERWHIWLGAACRRRGWRFVVNSPEPADLYVALRDGKWDGWICREWKSGVKLVNAIAAGRPVITQASAAGLELQPPSCRLVDDQADLERALDALTPYAIRQDIYDACMQVAPRYSLSTIATEYRAMLADMRASCVA